jgi:hypothetical protein
MAVAFVRVSAASSAKKGTAERLGRRAAIKGRGLVTTDGTDNTDGRKAAERRSRWIFGALRLCVSSKDAGALLGLTPFGLTQRR